MRPREGSTMTRQLPQPPPKPWGSFTHAPFICVYGRSGAGKTADAIKTFPDGYFVGLEGAHKSWATWGPDMAPDEEQMLLPMLTQFGIRPSFRALALVFRAIHTKRLPWRPAVICDDVSLMADHDALEIEAEVGNTWDKWRMIGQRISLARNMARMLDMAILVNGHDVGPRADPTKDFIPGGIKMPSHAARAEFAKLPDTNLRVVSDPSFGHWRYAYQVDDGDPEWFTKDRHNKVRGRVPLNLREALIQKPNPLWIPRRVGLEWCDHAADKVVRLALAGAPRHEAAQQVEAEAVSKGFNPDTAYMAAMDGLDRAWYAQRDRVSRFAAPETTGSSPF